MRVCIYIYIYTLIIISINTNFIFTCQTIFVWFESKMCRSIFTCKIKVIVTYLVNGLIKGNNRNKIIGMRKDKENWYIYNDDKMGNIFMSKCFNNGNYIKSV